MKRYIKELINEESFFALYNENNFNNYIIYDGLFFTYEEFKIISYYFYDLFDFDICSMNDGNELIIKLNNSIKEHIGFEYCGFYPKLNCKYSNNYFIEENINLKEKIINKIRKIQNNRFLPSNINNKVICFHNGDGEFKDGVPLNPIVFGVDDFLILKKFCLLYFNYDLETAFHGKSEVTFNFLEDNMKSFFQRRIISSNFKKDILFSSEEIKKDCFLEKEHLLNIIKNILQDNN